MSISDFGFRISAHPSHPSEPQRHEEHREAQSPPARPRRNHEGTKTPRDSPSPPTTRRESPQITQMSTDVRSRSPGAGRGLRPSDGRKPPCRDSVSNPSVRPGVPPRRPALSESAGLASSHLEPLAKFRKTDLTGFQIACAAQTSFRVVLVGAPFRVREKSTEASVRGP